MARGDRVSASLTIVLAVALYGTSAGCCATIAGPTVPAASYSATLEPGALRFYDTDIPPSTTQINLDFVVDSSTVALRIRQIDPSCTPAIDDACQTFSDVTLPSRPAGVVQFSNTLQPPNSRTRIVLQNTSSSERVTYTVTITPFRAGCT